MSPTRLAALALISIGSALVAFLLNEAGWVFDELEIVTEGWRQQATVQEVLPADSLLSIDSIRAKKAEDPDYPISDVAIVFFDENAVDDWEYFSPYPRRILADLVETLHAGGAAAIGIDVFLGDRMDLDPEQDERLAAAMREAGNVVLVAPTVIDTRGDSSYLASPDPLFADAAWAVAAADLPSAYGSATDAALVVRSGDRLEAGFAVALWAKRQGLDLDSMLTVWRAEREVSLPGLPAEYGRIPDDWFTAEQDVQGAVLPLPIRFVGPSSVPAIEEEAPTQTFQAVSAGFLRFQLMLQPNLYRGKTVLLGSGWHDQERFQTPFSGYKETVLRPDPATGDSVPVVLDDAFQWTYGVEIHANVLQNLIDAEYMRRPTPIGELGWLLAFALLVSLAVFQAGPIVGLAGFGVAILGIFATAFWAWSGQIGLNRGLTLFDLNQAYLMLPMVPMALSSLVAYLGSASWVALVENREKRFIEGAFGKYVSPDVVKTIARDPAALQLGGQKRMLSIFFSDLSGFTTLSERLEPEQLIAHLNEYLTEMTRIVMDEGGTLDKYIGDAIMAFWNAPATIEDHADRALRCAIFTQRKMDELNAKWLADDPEADTLVVRIGINSGEVVVGNVGGENRFDYSAIGDSVNLAARLEPANKTYETLNMCSEYTRALLKRPDDYRFRELDVIAVKGKKKPVRVYEIVEMADAQLPAHRERCLALFEQGFARYRRHEWAAAAEDFAAALEADPKDGPSALYLDRCRDNEADPPPADWDFVVRRNVK